MKNSIKIVFVLLTLAYVSVNAQQKVKESEVKIPPTYNSVEDLPKISKDSTQAELTAHIEAANDWMQKEHYKLNFVPPLIYSETALSLANKIEDIEVSS